MSTHLPIDVYDSATPEPGYEGMNVYEIMNDIRDYEREQREEEKIYRSIM